MRWYLRRRIKDPQPERAENNEKWLLAAARCILTACSSGGKIRLTISYRFVQGGRRHMIRSTSAVGRQVSIPDYLAGNGVVSKTTDVQCRSPIIICGPVRWISSCVPLVAKISASSCRLGSVVPTAGASRIPSAFAVNGFHGRYDGRSYR